MRPRRDDEARAFFKQWGRDYVAIGAPPSHDYWTVRQVASAFARYVESDLEYRRGRRKENKLDADVHKSLYANFQGNRLPDPDRSFSIGEAIGEPVEVRRELLKFSRANKDDESEVDCPGASGLQFLLMAGHVRHAILLVHEFYKKDRPLAPMLQRYFWQLNDLFKCDGGTEEPIVRAKLRLHWATVRNRPLRLEEFDFHFTNAWNNIILEESTGLQLILRVQEVIGMGLEALSVSTRTT